MDRNLIVTRIENLRAQKAQSENIARQVDANIHALAGAIQFATDLLAEEDKQTDPTSSLIVP